MTIDAFKDLAEHIEESLAGAVDRHQFKGNELVIYARREDLLRVLQFLRDDRECDCKMLMDITAVDYPEREERFVVVYNLLSLNQNQRVRVKVTASENTPVPSVCGLFSSANWLEREVWDMFGIFFSGHPDLRRILTDYGFDGYPLRRDFPLTGHVELRYDEELRRVVYEPVKLDQAFRDFDSISPWEAMTGVQLPGDEKGMKPQHGWTTSNVNLRDEREAS